MEIDYKEVFRAFNKYLEEWAREMDYRERINRGKPYLLSRSEYNRMKDIQGYYLGSVSEERFLSACDDLDGDLYDDYADMYEPNNTIYGIPLEHYVYELQKITGKHPKTVHHWCYLRVTPASK